MEPLLIPYRKSTLWGYCTPGKTIVIPCEYGWAGTFTGDAAIVKKNGKYGAINRSGKVFFPFSYTSLEQANHEIYGLEDGIILNGDPEMEGDDGVPPEEGTVYEYAEVSFMYSNGRYILPNVSFPSQPYESLANFFDGLVWAKKEGKWGTLTPSGMQVIPFMYDDVEPFDEDYPTYAFVLLNHRWGVINRNNIQYWED